MEIVGAAASITQLAVYTYSAGRCLRHLYKTSKTSQFSAGSQLEDLNVLLKILDCINSHHTPLDHEVLVPVLISIAETAQTLSNWFLQTSTFYRNWVFFFRKADIQGGYRLLRQKCNFLVFYYSERNNRALNRIESSLNTQYHAASGCLDSMDAPKSNEGRAMEVGITVFNSLAALLSLLVLNTRSGCSAARGHRKAGYQKAGYRPRQRHVDIACRRQNEYRLGRSRARAPVLSTTHHQSISHAVRATSRKETKQRSINKEDCGVQQQAF
jgi:hypothetical protein